MWRATGSTSVRNPSRTALPTWAGIDASSSAAVAASASICSRERSSAASMSAGAGRPAAASAIRCFARSSARASMRAEATLRAGWTLPSSTTTFHRSSSRSIRSSRAMPRGSSSTGESSGGIEHRTFSELPDLVGDRLVVVNDTKVVPARLRLRRSSGGGGRGAARREPRTTGGGRRSRGRRVACGQVSSSGPCVLVEPLGAGRWIVELEGEPGGRGAASSVHPRAARRPRAVPDRLRRGQRLGGGSHGRSALHSRARRASSIRFG